MNIPVPLPVQTLHLSCKSDPAVKWKKDDIIGFVIYSQLQFLKSEGFIQRFRPGYVYIRKAKNLEVNLKKQTSIQIMTKLVTAYFGTNTQSLDICMAYFMRKDKKWVFLPNLTTNINQVIGEAICPAMILFNEQQQNQLLKGIEHWVKGGPQNCPL
ncbi:UNKNOWN [Stylonychia lemnae]|uniref:Uncharacterized protein n=1 Tax=Stylonychia lemnae TaxID=5949 RepID=A0A078ACD4_STYLE|nr:UNKNOWN [Stylonychia lemnae]|eukprot:CDW78478.1 UNKNOWN [Stylonychia lemnae]